MKRRQFIKGICCTLASIYAPLSLFKPDPVSQYGGGMTGDYPVAQEVRRAYLLAIAAQMEKMETEFWTSPTLGAPVGISHFVLQT